jgi:hypothetical protein
MEKSATGDHADLHAPKPARIRCGLILAIVGGATAAPPVPHSNAFADKFFAQGLYEALEKLE